MRKSFNKKKRKKPISIKNKSLFKTIKQQLSDLSVIPDIETIEVTRMESLPPPLLSKDRINDELIKKLSEDIKDRDQIIDNYIKANHRLADEADSSMKWFILTLILQIVYVTYFYFKH